MDHCAQFCKSQLQEEAMRVPKLEGLWNEDSPNRQGLNARKTKPAGGYDGSLKKRVM